MIKAIEKRTLKAEDLPHFNYVVANGNKFKVFDLVRVTKKDGCNIIGQISDIRYNSIDILSRHSNLITLRFDVIEDITN